MGSYINPANAITASRFFSLPPFLYFVDNGYYQWAGIVVIACAILDLVDGKVARMCGCTSGFGELFDAIADGICYGFFMIVSAVYGLVSVTAVGILVGLGLVNTILRGYYAKRAGRATNYRSYAMERMVGYVAFLSGYGVTGFFVDYYYWVGVVCMAIVLIHDVKRMVWDPVPE